MGPDWGLWLPIIIGAGAAGAAAITALVISAGDEKDDAASSVREAEVEVSSRTLIDGSAPPITKPPVKTGG